MVGWLVGTDGYWIALLLFLIFYFKFERAVISRRCTIDLGFSYWTTKV